MHEKANNFALKKTVNRYNNETYSIHYSFDDSGYNSDCRNIHGNGR